MCVCVCVCLFFFKFFFLGKGGKNCVFLFCFFFLFMEKEEGESEVLAEGGATKNRSGGEVAQHVFALDGILKDLFRAVGKLQAQVDRLDRNCTELEGFCDDLGQVCATWSQWIVRSNIIRTDRQQLESQF